MISIYLKALFKKGHYTLGDPWPEIEVSRPNVSINAEHLANYREVCGFPNTTPSDIPATYPQVLAFPLHMQILTDSRFPLQAMGIIHISNEIDFLTHLSNDKQYTLTARLKDNSLTPNGIEFSIQTELLTDNELVWKSSSTMLWRYKTGLPRQRNNTEKVKTSYSTPLSLSADLGRRYAKCSGDLNPIHLWPVTAKALGFKQQIIHGMWSKARCLAELSDQLPEHYRVSVNFKKPLYLPNNATFVYDSNSYKDNSGPLKFELKSRISPQTVSKQNHLIGFIKAI